MLCASAGTGKMVAAVAVELHRKRLVEREEEQTPADME